MGPIGPIGPIFFGVVDTGSIYFSITSAFPMSNFAQVFERKAVERWVASTGTRVPPGYQTLIIDW